MLEAVRNACSNWLITPAALAINEAPPVEVREQKFMLVLTGVVVIDFAGQAPNWPWTHDTLHIRPDLDAPLGYAVNRHQIPTPTGEPGLQYTREFLVEQCAAFAGVAAFESSPDRVIGAACDAWRPHHYETRTDAFTSAQLHPIFAGIDADLADRAVDGRIHRVNYHIALLGKVVFGAVIIT
jgi:hypothetical protein